MDVAGLKQLAETLEKEYEERPELQGTAPFLPLHPRVVSALCEHLISADRFFEHQGMANTRRFVKTRSALEEAMSQ